MLLKSIIRETLGIKRHVVKSVTGDTKGIVVKLDRRRLWRLPCSRCGRLGRVRDRLKVRRWQHVPLWGIPVDLVYARLA